jgi:hypothetical protein
MDEEWDLIVCEKGVSLYQNDNSYHKIIFDVKKADDTYESILELIKNKDFFDLLFELNKDLIDNITATTIDTEMDAQYVTIKIINNKSEYFNYPHFTMHINYYNKVEDKNITMQSIPFDNNKSTENEIYLSTFIIKIEEHSDKVSFFINYCFDENVFDADLVKTSISMYILKVFYRLKLYFE